VTDAVGPTIVWTSPLGAGSLQGNFCAGPAFGTYFLAVTFYAGNFPNGWLYGVAIPLSELVAELSDGFPFVASLDGTGAFQLGPFGGGSLPSGATFYDVVLTLPLGSPVPTEHTAANSYVIP
jgi:hypothetical protein